MIREVLPHIPLTDGDSGEESEHPNEKDPTQEPDPEDDSEIWIIPRRPITVERAATEGTRSLPTTPVRRRQRSTTARTRRIVSGTPKRPNLLEQTRIDKALADEDVNQRRATKSAEDRKQRGKRRDDIDATATEPIPATPIGVEHITPVQPAMQEPLYPDSLFNVTVDSTVDGTQRVGGPNSNSVEGGVPEVIPEADAPKNSNCKQPGQKPHTCHGTSCCDNSFQEDQRNLAKARHGHAQHGERMRGDGR